ncbi:ATP-dependent DNA ligase (EC 6.5.1.1) (plasmid) [Mycetohabitans rhizoxinica HKI 454]|uniref:ATP-dependent DNA ligase n=1 Tax=Mycetohabitans rhizoxinica (strain DSM 19002 / CIP 109453 / HKI 454) TaxID=882378 RepID=E5ATY3_MYCRK|nr:ATP-dependent DNA ligase (EC 6.5.1.1) [Mycetohabitans rhizoxinica HKI 454]
MPVSVPIRRDELTSLKSANQWTIANLHHRLAEQDTDPWHGYARVRQTITAQMRERIGMKEAIRLIRGAAQ